MPALNTPLKYPGTKKSVTLRPGLPQPTMCQEVTDESYNINGIHDISSMIRGQEKLATIFNLFA